MRVQRLPGAGQDPRSLAARLRSLAPGLETAADTVSETISEVRERGDRAVLELTARFDATERPPEELRVDPAAPRRALESLQPEVRAGLELARENIRAVAERQLRASPVEVELPQGQSVRVREVAVGAAGVYAPGGRAAYPSSVLMCAVPARVAGVERIAVASPPGPDGSLEPATLAACAVAEADEVYAMGGAQAIAALALGTESCPAVDVVAGPGSRYVTEAKRQLSGTVGIDLLAGPSEIMLILDRSADAHWAALDLLAQAEHGADGLLVVASPDAAILEDVVEHVERLAAERPSVADAPLAAVPVADLEEAVTLSVALAPEHLQLMCDGAEVLAERATTAGCVLCGGLAATAFGDYAAGSNHVLPTGGAGRFAGPLGPATFLRRQSIVSLTVESARALSPHVAALARAEGFPVHAESAEARS